MEPKVALKRLKLVVNFVDLSNFPNDRSKIQFCKPDFDFESLYVLVSLLLAVEATFLA